MTTFKHKRRFSLPIGIALAWILCLCALVLAQWIGDLVQTHFSATERVRQGVHALVMSGMVLPGIWWLRTRADGLSLSGLGLPDVRRSFIHLSIGAGLVLVPMLLTIAATSALGWAAIQIDLTLAGMGALLAGIITALLYEAIPEELVFRGYIYSNLSDVYKRWLAGALTVALFVLLPTVLVYVQKYALGMQISIGDGADHITAEYVITLLVFGSFVQYLRIQSGSVWTSIGFHAMFVLAGRVMGPQPSAFVRFTELSPEQSIQLVLVGGLLLAVIVAIVYPRLSKKRTFNAEGGG